MVIGRDEKCAGRHAAAAYLCLSNHIHRRWGFNPAFFAISNPPLARSAGFSCAAACNQRPATILAFAQHRFDLPLPSMVLHAHAAVAALAVQRVAAARFTRAIVNAVDAGSVGTRNAGDEEDEGFRHEVLLRRGGVELW